MQLDKNHVPSTTSIQSDNVHQSRHSCNKNNRNRNENGFEINSEAENKNATTSNTMKN